MRAAFQMDHPTRLNPPSDSTFMMIEEGIARGHECYFYEAQELSWYNGEIVAPLKRITVDMNANPTYQISEPAMVALSDMDVVWMRQDPPFDMHYINATHLLEHVLPTTKVFNNPMGVRNAPEKLSVLHMHRFLPPTLVSSDAKLVHEFAAKHGTVVAKPLHGNGGRGVFRFAANDPNIDTLLEQQREQSGEPLMWQAFLREVATTDVRIMLIGGEPAAVFQREPQGDSIRANMRVGGIAKASQFTDRQLEVCAALAPALRDAGLIFVGLDMIGDYLTEINVTSPTGLRAVQQLYSENLAARLWDMAG